MAFKDYTGQDPNQRGQGGNAPGNNGGNTPQGGSPYWNPILPANPPGQGTPGTPEELGLINYNKKFKNAQPALFREGPIGQAIATLSSFLKPNCILTGPAGCGKTRIVEDIARMLEGSSPLVPKQLEGFTVYELPLGALMSGTKYRGEMEEKLLNIIAFLGNKKNKAILFLDEIHMLMGQDESYREIAQILKPALGRGNLRTIGATTTQEASLLMKDPAFDRRFSAVVVNELTPAQTAEILEGLRPQLSLHYGVSIPQELVPEVVSLADQKKKAWHHRPDNAIRLLDRAAGDAMLERLKLLDSTADPTMKALLKNTPPTLTWAQAEKTAHHLLTGQAEQPEVSQESLEKALSKIQGQDGAVTRLIRETVKAALNLYPSKKPQAWIFAGPSGTGKTETAKTLSQELTGNAPIILNMAEFHSPESINRIIGSPAGYVGYDSSQELPFDILDSNPFQVILLDEFEKCDRGVQRLFMSTFEEGVIQTAKNKIIDFSKAIIIATTNAGVKRDAPLGFNAKEAAPTASALAKDFDPELLNRIGEKHTLFFQPIGKETYGDICQETYKSLASGIRLTRPSIPLPDEIPPDELGRLVETTYDPMFNARPSEEAVKAWIEDFVLAWQSGTQIP